MNRTSTRCDVTRISGLNLPEQSRLFEICYECSSGRKQSGTVKKRSVCLFLLVRFFGSAYLKIALNILNHGRHNDKQN